MENESYSFYDLYRKLPRAKFVPLIVPWERRLQMLGITYYFTLFLHTQFVMLLLASRLIFWPVIISYCFFIYFDSAPDTGERRSDWYRCLPNWKWFADYFPINFVKEEDLDPNKNYIFAAHPHGIHATSFALAFGTEGLNISNIFPGIKTYIITVNTNFVFPIYRECLIAMGAIRASKEIIEGIFSKGKGYSTVIIVGGAEESLYSTPSSSDLVLAKRYGFISLALKNGVSVVPTYSFNENKLFDLYQPPPGSVISILQAQFKKYAGFAFPLYMGRGMFTYNYGFFPKRHPTTIVTGKPIHLEKDINPSKEKVQAVHQQYMDALKDLYERNKEKYTVGEMPPIRFI